MSKQSVLIVEDEPGIADTLQYALRTDGFEPHWVATGEAALARASAEVPAALVILDVGLPDLNGFEVFKRLRDFSDVPVVFTHRACRRDRSCRRPRTRRRRLRRQAVLAARTGGAAARHPSSRVSRSGGGRQAGAPFAVDEGRRQIRFYGQVLDLSRYEYGLLKTLIERPGHVYSRDTLLDKVWDERSDSLDRTVDAHVKTLRAKLKQVAPRLEPIRTHRGGDYALAEDLPPSP